MQAKIIKQGLGSLCTMFEPYDHNSNIIRGMMRKGMLQQLLARLLCIFNIVDELNCTLIPNHIP